MTDGLTIEPGFVDYNGHLNLAYYMVLFDRATDRLFDALDLGATRMARDGRSVFVLDARIRYLREVCLGDVLEIETRVVAHDGKRLEWQHAMYRRAEGDPVAAVALVGIQMDMATRTPVPFDQHTMDCVAARLADDGAGNGFSALLRPFGLPGKGGIHRAGETD